jgi:hypothetical protein
MTSGVAPIGAEGHHPRNIEGRGDLAGSAELDSVAQIGADQGRVDESQSVAKRHAHVIHEFERGGSGAALGGAVDDDEVRGDAGLEHGLDDGKKLPRVADAKLEADRLAPRGGVAWR